MASNLGEVSVGKRRKIPISQNGRGRFLVARGQSPLAESSLLYNRRRKGGSRHGSTGAPDNGSRSSEYPVLPPITPKTAGGGERKVEEDAQVIESRNSEEQHFESLSEEELKNFNEECMNNIRELEGLDDPLTQVEKLRQDLQFRNCSENPTDEEPSSLSSDAPTSKSSFPWWKDEEQIKFMNLPPITPDDPLEEPDSKLNLDATSRSLLTSFIRRAENKFGKLEEEPLEEKEDEEEF